MQAKKKKGNAEEVVLLAEEGSNLHVDVLVYLCWPMYRAYHITGARPITRSEQKYDNKRRCHFPLCNYR
jgi:hypothetical protein